MNQWKWPPFVSVSGNSHQSFTLRSGNKRWEGIDPSTRAFIQEFCKKDPVHINIQEDNGGSKKKRLQSSKARARCTPVYGQSGPAVVPPKRGGKKTPSTWCCSPSEMTHGKIHPLTGEASHLSTVSGTPPKTLLPGNGRLLPRSFSLQKKKQFYSPFKTMQTDLFASPWNKKLN